MCNVARVYVWMVDIFGDQKILLDRSHAVNLLLANREWESTIPHGSTLEKLVEATVSMLYYFTDVYTDPSFVAVLRDTGWVFILRMPWTSAFLSLASSVLLFLVAASPFLSPGHQASSSCSPAPSSRLASPPDTGLPWGEGKELVGDEAFTKYREDIGDSMEVLVDAGFRWVEGLLPKARRLDPPKDFTPKRLRGGVGSQENTPQGAGRANESQSEIQPLDSDNSEVEHISSGLERAEDRPLERARGRPRLDGMGPFKKPPTTVEEVVTYVLAGGKPPT